MWLKTIACYLWNFVLLILFLAISVPIGLLIFILDLELVEYNAPEWVQPPLPHPSEESFPDPLPLEHAGRTLET